MAIVDERGRLFGRLNLLDAAVLVLLAGLVPLGLAAYSLFREKPAVLSSVTPDTIQAATESALVIRGENLRPYMRISAGPRQALGFIFKSTEEAEIPFANLPAGEYDIILYDQSQERARLPKALTVLPGPLPATQVVAVGTLGNLDAAAAGKIAPGLAFDGVAEVIRVGPAEPDRTTIFAGNARVGVMVPDARRVPAVLRVTCSVVPVIGRPECKIGSEGSVAPTQLFLLSAPFGKVPFYVEQVMSLDPVQQIPIEVRVTGPLTVLEMVVAGDADHGGTANELAAGATVTRAGAVRATSAGNGERDLSLRADVQATPGGWVYDSAPLRAGSSFAFRTQRYVVQGVVTTIPPPPAAPATR